MFKVALQVGFEENNKRHVFLNIISYRDTVILIRFKQLVILVLNKLFSKGICQKNILHEIQKDSLLFVDLIYLQICLA